MVFAYPRKSRGGAGDCGIDQLPDHSPDIKKNEITSDKIEYWVIPPNHSAEFAAHMEQVITTYELPYDPAYPVINMDEQPVQLVKETRQSIEATANHGKRIDYEYERAGTAALFMFTEPLAGWRQVTARSTRTKKDWALEMANLLEGRYAECEKVTVICDNLNTPTFGAFYEAFEPELARQLACRIQCCYTPKERKSTHQHCSH